MANPKRPIPDEEKIKDPITPEEKAPEKDPVKKDREYNLDHETHKKNTDTNDKDVFYP